MKIKQISMILVIGLLFSLFIGVAFATPSENTNLLTNGDFESGKKAWGNTSGDFASVSEEVLDQNVGKKMKLSRNNTDGSEWIYQLLTPEEYTPGATYHAKVDIYGDLTKSAGFSLLVKYYKKGSPEYGSNGTNRYQGNTNERWNTLEFDFTVPMDCDESIRIWLRLFGQGTVYVDNVALYKMTGPDPYIMDNSHVFHYDERDIGELSVNLHPFYQETDEKANATVRFIISDNGKVLNQKTVSLAERKAQFIYKAGDFLTDERKSCQYKIQVFDASNVLQKEKKGELSLVPRPSRLNEDGDYIINTKLFHPVIGYGIPIPKSDTEEEQKGFLAAKEMGINVVFVPMAYSRWGNNESTPRDELKNVLYQLEKHDLYGIFTLYSTHVVSEGTTLCTAAGCEEELKNTRLMADKLSKEERVFAWAIMDEPFGAGILEERARELELAYKEIRSRDTMHPVFLCDYTDDYFDEDIKYCDIFAPDIYSGSLTRVLEAGSNAVNIAKIYTKPVYLIVSVYTSSFYKPTEISVRHTVYQAIIAGAKGIGYYSFEYCGEDGNTYLWDTELYEGMQRIKIELLTIFKLAQEASYTEKWTEAFIARIYGRELAVILPLSNVDLYVGLYAENELTEFFTTKNNSTLLVTVPKGENALNVFAFLPGTITSFVNKVSL